MPRKKPTPDIADDAAQITRAPRKRSGPPNLADREAHIGEDHLEELRAAAPSRRQAPRPARELPREPARAPARRGAAMVAGRDGEMLTRRRTTVGDVHHVPPEEIPAGWDYQWNSVSVHGMELREEQLVMAANGWRPVPASRHPGRWTPADFKGAIIVKGLRLEERPSELGNEARAEDIARAKAQVRDQTDTLKLSKKLPDGMAVNRHYRGTGADVRMSIDPGLDIPRPAHEIED